MAAPAPKPDLAMPVLPPLLHTRSCNDGSEQPSTPTRQQDAFISPAQTPQGSPSKNKMPPGAFDLPDVFSTALKLIPTAGQPNTKALQSRQQGAASPTRHDQDPFGGQDARAGAPGSPTRKQGKENTPPTHRPALQQEKSFITQAAASRQEPYRQREEHPPNRAQTFGGRLTHEELEKLQKPNIKRLANGCEAAGR